MLCIPFEEYSTQYCGSSTALLCYARYGDWNIFLLFLVALATIVCIGMVGVTAGERTVVRNFLKNKLCKK